jgi:hypothetical protein
MEWRPPRSIAERQEWAKAHPWLVGCWFGVTFFAFSVVLGLEKTTLWRSIVGGALVSVVAALLFVPLFKLGSKRRWGEHTNAEALPPPTWTRMWSRTSDRFLRWTLVLSSLAFLVSAADVASGTDHAARASIALLAGTWLVVTTWLERRRRAGKA